MASVKAYGRGCCGDTLCSVWEPQLSNRFNKDEDDLTTVFGSIPSLKSPKTLNCRGDGNKPARRVSCSMKGDLRNE